VELDPNPNSKKKGGGGNPPKWCKKIQIVKDLKFLWIPEFRGSIVGSLMAYMCTSFGFMFCWCNKNVFKITFWYTQM
jgi:hypothetical protein